MALVPFADIYRPALYLLAIALLVWALFSVLIRSAARAAAITSVLLVFFFFFRALWATGGPLLGAHAKGEFLLYWGVGLAGVLVAAAWKRRNEAFLTHLLNWMSVAMLASSAYSVFSGWQRIQREVASVNNAPKEAVASDATAGPRPPDIYYIVVDGYGRQDALKRYLGFDNSPFVSELEKRGFYVASNSHSNYAQTEQSLASSLNMQYLQPLLQDARLRADSRAPLDALIQRNSLVGFLKSKGYLYVGVPSGFPPISMQGADLRLQTANQLTLFEATLIDNTPVRLPASGALSPEEARRTDLKAAFTSLRRLAPSSSRPRFVLAHIFAPHPPFVFNPDGSPRKLKVGFSFADGSHYLATGSTTQEYSEGYSAQIQWLNRELLSAVDAIVANATPRPIIVIQGDHGPKSRLDQESLARTELSEVFPILNAYLLPDDLKGLLYPDITPVNSFRLILDGLFGADLPRLQDRSFYSTWEEPYQFADVTNALE